MRQPVVHVASIRKTYGSTVAVDEVSFDVQPGEIFGLIGPNGAGKTTTMECVDGLRTPDRGLISVLGLDPRRDAYALQGFQLVGGPSWLDSERFDILAKAEGNPTPDQERLMLRSLLAERFALSVHVETRELPLYAMVMTRADGRPGPRLRRTGADCSSATRTTRGRADAGSGSRSRRFPAN